jgi:hypothetical protein
MMRWQRRERQHHRFTKRKSTKKSGIFDELIVKRRHACTPSLVREGMCMEARWQEGPIATAGLPTIRTVVGHFAHNLLHRPSCRSTSAGGPVTQFPMIRRQRRGSRHYRQPTGRRTNLDDSGCRRGPLLIVLCRFSAVVAAWRVAVLPDVLGAAPAPTAPGRPPFRVDPGAGARRAGSRGGGAAASAGRAGQVRDDRGRLAAPPPPR